MSNYPQQQEFPNQTGMHNFSDNHRNVTSMGGHDEEKTFGRTRMLLDPAQIDEMERKKKAAMQHKREIDAQIAEKKRIQMLEEEIKQLNDLKFENEAKHIKSINQINQETKQKQPQYANLNVSLNNTQLNEIYIINNSIIYYIILKIENIIIVMKEKNKEKNLKKEELLKEELNDYY